MKKENRFEVGTLAELDGATDRQDGFLHRGEAATLEIAKDDWMDVLSWLIPADCIDGVKEATPDTYAVSLILGPTAAERWALPAE